MAWRPAAGDLLLATALAPTADSAAARSPAADAADLILTVSGGLLLGYGLRWAFGQPAAPPLRARRSLLLLVALMVVGAPLLPAVFAQQALDLMAGGVGGYVICVPRAR